MTDRRRWLRTGEIDAWLAKLGGIPTDSRAFAFSTAEAQDHFGFEPELLSELLEAGLVYRFVDDELRFDFTDLHFVALRLRTAPAYLKALRIWAQTLERFGAAECHRVLVRYLPRTVEGLDGRQAVARLPDGGAQQVELSGQRVVAQFERTLVSHARALPD